VKILSDLKLNHDEPDEVSAILKGSSAAESDALRPSIENDAAVAMLRAIPGVSGNQLKYVMGKVESLREFVDLSKDELISLLGEDGGKKAWQFIHSDSRRIGFGRSAGAARPSLPVARSAGRT
jgi:DNA excision repair protein ERCC-4